MEFRKMVQVILFAKQKQTQMERANTWITAGKEVVRWLGLTCKHYWYYVQIRCLMRPCLQLGELWSMLPPKSMLPPQWEGNPKGVLCVCHCFTLYSTMETSTTLYNNYTPVEINFKKEKKSWSYSQEYAHGKNPGVCTGKEVTIEKRG